MCASSYVGDYFHDTFLDRHPGIGMPINPGPNSLYWTVPVIPVDRAEFDALKAEVTELRELLKAAKRFDEKTGQKDCEYPDNIAFLKSVAEFVGVDLKDVLA